MSRCLNLTRSGEYAIAALSRLALITANSASEYIPIQVLAESQSIPKSFLRKILRLCLKKGLLTAKSGPMGGVKLAKPSNSMTLLEIIESCEGNYRRDFCVFYPGRRCEGTDCSVYCPLRKKEEDLKRSLDCVTLAGMTKALKIHPNNLMINTLRHE